MTKFILLPAGALTLWLYQNISHEAWQAIIGLTLAVVISFLIMLTVGLKNQNAILSNELATVQHQLQWSEERRKIASQRKTRPSMRRGRA